MDLDCNNYTIEEILQILEIDENNPDAGIIQKNLSDKITIISKQDPEQISENIDELINFYTKAAFKLMNNNKIINNNIKKQELSEKQNIINNEQIIPNKLINIEDKPIINRPLIPGGVTKPIPPIYSINTNPNKHVQGIVNPIERQTINSLLSINSKFRHPNSTSSTDFIVELNQNFSNVTSIKLASIEFINSYYAISEYLGSNHFTIEFFKYSLSFPITILEIFKETFYIPDGNYTIDQFVTTVNDIFQEPGKPYTNLVELAYDPIKGKLNFIKGLGTGNTWLPPCGGIGCDFGFNLDFTNINLPKRANFLNLGWLIGYRHNKYPFFELPPPDPSCNNTLIPGRIKNIPICMCDCDDDYYNYKYISPCNNYYKNFYQDTSNNNLNIGFNPEAVANLIGTGYFLLEIDDFNKNQSEVFYSNTQLSKNNVSTFTHNFSNIIARIPNTADFFFMMFEDSSDKVFKTRKYFGPVRLNRLKIRLLDENGTVINLNNNDIVINLEIESNNMPYKKIL
tara:strand:+ start:514 stop:2049 length:1536 start_codon:yes stop_codon:yes gene_type:complete